jgi:hypothetical protein
MSFLVAVPLLMPPGLCACRLGLPAPAQTVAESAGTCSSARRACCGHRKFAAKRTADRRASSCDSTTLTANKVPAQPGQVHESGCPALLTADHAKLARQNKPAPTILTTHPDGVRSIDAVAAATSPVADFHPPRPASRSLYLSFRTLLI